MNIKIIGGILLPFLGTSLGAAMVFFLKDSISKNLQRVLTGFAAGVMVAASFWSLLQPALDGSEHMGRLSFIPAAVGFLIGIGFLLLLDEITPHMHMDSEEEGPRSSLKRTTKLILAVTLHNIPEGMAVGVVYANLLAGKGLVSEAGALVLALGIAIQNFPEGAIVSMPLVAEGMPKGKTFWYGVLSGAVEPIGGACDDPRVKLHHVTASVSACICCRGNVLCCRRRADPGNVGRRTFKLGHDRIQLRLRADDDPGCGFRIGIFL